MPISLSLYALASPMSCRNALGGTWSRAAQRMPTRLLREIAGGSQDPNRRLERPLGSGSLVLSIHGGKTAICETYVAGLRL